MTRKELTERIEAFRTLEKNWDSYDADPINKSTIDFALLVVDVLPNIHTADWFVAPCGSGSIMFESETEGIYTIDGWKEGEE